MTPCLSDTLTMGNQKYFFRGRSINDPAVTLKGSLFTDNDRAYIINRPTIKDFISHPCKYEVDPSSVEQLLGSNAMGQDIFQGDIVSLDSKIYLLLDCPKAITSASLPSIPTAEKSVIITEDNVLLIPADELEDAIIVPSTPYLPS